MGGRGNKDGHGGGLKYLKDVPSPLRPSSPDNRIIYKGPASFDTDSSGAPSRLSSRGTSDTELALLNSNRGESFSRIAQRNPLGWQKIVQAQLEHEKFLSSMHFYDYGHLLATERPSFEGMTQLDHEDFGRSNNFKSFEIPWGNSSHKKDLINPDKQRQKILKCLQKASPETAISIPSESTIQSLSSMTLVSSSSARGGQGSSSKKVEPTSPAKVTFFGGRQKSTGRKSENVIIHESVVAGRVWTPSVKYPTAAASVKSTVPSINIASNVDNKPSLPSKMVSIGNGHYLLNKLRESSLRSAETQQREGEQQKKKLFPNSPYATKYGGKTSSVFKGSKNSKVPPAHTLVPMYVPSKGTKRATILVRNYVSRFDDKS